MKKPFQRIAALTLSAALALGCCGGALAVDADENDASTPGITEGENENVSSTPDATQDGDTGTTDVKIVQSEYNYYCMKDATLEEMKAKLPSEVTITLTTGETETMQNANWQQDTEDPYLGNGYNADYRFKLVLPDGYKYNYDGSSTMVEFYNCTDDKGIVEQYGKDFTLASDSNTIEAMTAEINAAYPELSVKTNDGKTKTIPITWSADPRDIEDYMAGKTSAIQFGFNLPEGYRPVADCDLDIITYVITCRLYHSDTIRVSSFKETTYSIKVTNATAATALQSLPSEVEVTLSNGKAVKIPAKWEQVQSNSDAAFEFKFVFPEGYTASSTRTTIPNALVYNTVTEPTTPSTPSTTGDAAASGTSTVTATSTTTATGTTSTAAKSEAKATKSPKTADESHALLAVSALALSAATLTCVAVISKKRKDA